MRRVIMAAIAAMSLLVLTNGLNQAAPVAPDAIQEVGENFRLGRYEDALMTPLRAELC